MNLKKVAQNTICFIGYKNATSANLVSFNITKLKFNAPQNSNLISRIQNVEIFGIKLFGLNKKKCN